MDSNTQTKSGLSGSNDVYTSPPSYPPPYFSHPAPQPVIGVNVVPVVGPTIVLTQQMGPNPARVTCKSCHKEIVTTTKSKATTRTHIIAGILCLFFLWPCIIIPYCVDSCMNIDHYCPNCQSYIGSHVN